jgi:Tol biopolymer transport system component
LSANGRFLAFVSLDNELVAGDDNPWSDVFVRDLQSNTLERLVPTNRPPGIAICLRPAISADGRYVAWLEQPRLPIADELNDGHSVTNIVWLDRQTGESRFVQTTSSRFNMPTINAPALSPDGRLLAFPLSGQVYLRDMSQPGTNSTRISANYIFPEYQLPASGESGNPQFTSDGQWVVFSSDAGGSLVSNALSFRYGIYARNLAQNRTKAVSTPPSSSGGPVYTPNGELNFQVCQDARHVLFVMATNGYRHVYLGDLLTTNTAVLVCSDCFNPSASADGRFVAFDRQQTYGGPINAYVGDLQTGLTELVSQRTDGTVATNGFACTPVISGDGRFVAYRGGDARLVANDTNASADLFIRDRLLGFNFSITRQGLNRSHCFSPGTFSFGADGSTLLLSSQLPGLTAEDFSPSADVFLLRVGAADSDGDGIDDQWELAFFDTLARDGSDDFDGDGSSDRAEFLAATDPTNAGSTLPVLAISALSSSSRRVFWNAIPGRSYRVEFKDLVQVPGWTAIGNVQTASTTTASFTDTTIGTNSLRFYRVQILP